MTSKIESLEEYISLISGTYSCGHHVFRGVSNAQHKLILPGLTVPQLL
jgi:hypothetical protein